MSAHPHTSVAAPPRARPIVTLLGGLASLGYVATAHVPGQLDKDWVHLWTAGRAAFENPAQLYAAERHAEILASTYPDGVPERVWPPRNQRLGVFFYPPQAAWYYTGLGWMSRGAAAVINALVTMGLAITAAVIIGRLSGVPPISALLILLAFPPFFYNYALGQNAMLTAAVVLVAWWLVTRRCEMWAGIVLGLLVCKPNWLLAVAWIPVVHGRWRMVIGTCVGAAALTTVTAAAGGVDLMRQYLELLPQVVALPQEAGYTLQLKVSALGLFRKWFGPTPTAAALGYGAAAVVAALTWWRTRGLWSRDLARLWTCSILTALWINPHLNNYDLVLVAAVVPIMWRGAERRWVVVAAVCAMYAACPIDDRWSVWARIPLPSLTLLLMWAIAVVEARRAHIPRHTNADASAPGQAVCIEMVRG